MILRALAAVRWFAAVLLVACSAEAHDSTRTGSQSDDNRRWVIVSRRDSLTVEVDTMSFVRIDTLAYRVWVQWRYSQPQPGSSYTESKPYSSSRQQLDMDCSRRRLRERTEYFFDSGGFLGSQDQPGAAWQDAVPVSVGEDVVTGACRRAPAHLPIAP